MSKKFGECVLIRFNLTITALTCYTVPHPTKFECFVKIVVYTRVSFPPEGMRC